MNLIDRWFASGAIAAILISGFAGDINDGCHHPNEAAGYVDAGGERDVSWWAASLRNTSAYCLGRDVPDGSDAQPAAAADGNGREGLIGEGRWFDLFSCNQFG